ncbi:hypothetical protein GRI69_13755 [Erythrobacter vulgaris]|uniref:Uncharacterized protein n=1 Tax=Qipengyuania vulgaris TaxID=291985 RepID=A0A844XVC4_9SPHN|nr:hypothetical protein [Qipengyuania vulgaris]MXO49319.1 hypothetical protein [Qipengyuania vulgaris]
MDLNEHYRHWMHLRRPDVPAFMSAADLPMDVQFAHVGRDKASHRGIGLRTGLRELAAGAPNQDYLEEIGSLEKLEYLDLGWPVTAALVRVKRSPSKHRHRIHKRPHLRLVKRPTNLPRNLVRIVP